MNVQELLRGVSELLGHVLRWSWGFAQRRALPLFGSVAVVVLAVNSWSWYRDWMTQEIVLLSAPAGGAASSDAKSIARRITAQSTWFGRRYSVRMENTEGYEENRRRISQDESGRMIAFAHDGFGQAENVRILCPLERNVLHIMCRRGLLSNVSSQAADGAGGAPLLRRVLESSELLRPGRVYFGPPDSGTRQLATHVMKLYGRHGDMGWLEANGIANWYDMRAAFNSESIDLAFFLGPLGSTAIENIAQDRKCVLLDLGQDRDALWQGMVHIQPEQLAEASYNSAGFCPSELQTLATRRVVICSSAMSDPLAYFLAVQCHEALRDTIPHLPWEGAPPLQTADGALSYRLHPGAQRLKDNAGKPWLPNVGYLWSILGVWLATELVKYLNEVFRRRSAPQPLPAAEQSPYSILKRDLEEMVRQLERMPLELDRKELQEWTARAAEFRSRLLAVAAQKQLDEQQTHTLLEGARRELEHEIALRRARRPARVESQPDIVRKLPEQ